MFLSHHQSRHVMMPLNSTYITAVLTSVGAVVDTSIGDADTLSTAQTDELSDSTCLSDVTVVHNRPHLVDPVLSSIKVFRLKGDNNTLKGIVSAMKLLNRQRRYCGIVVKISCLTMVLCF